MKLHTSIDDTTILREEAILRTDLWRQKFMETFVGSDPSNVFRGFLIPIQDILEIATKFQDKDIQYVRAYMTAQYEQPGDQNVQLSMILVPADGNQKDVLFREEKGEEKSAIYDFTQPCPPCCDVTSPLHGPTAKQ